MWQRFTESARKAVFHAQAEAQKFGEGYVSTEHLLLGLLDEPGCSACLILIELGISLDVLRYELTQHLPKSGRAPSTDMTLTPRSKRVIDLSYDEARNLNNNYIGTEHLLLGLVREGDGLAGRLLDSQGVKLDLCRMAVMSTQELGHAEGMPSSPPPERKREYAWSEYDEAAQKILFVADEMSQTTGDLQITPYHLAMAILSLPDSTAAQAIREAGQEPQTVKDLLERQAVWAEGAPDLQLSPNTRRVIDAAVDHAAFLGSEQIGPAELLLGLAVGNPDGFGALLIELGVSPQKLRNAIKKRRSSG